MRDLVEYARANPRKIRCAVASGTGNVKEIALRVIAQKEHIDWIYVPYAQGDGAGLTDLLGGHVEVLSQLAGLGAACPVRESSFISQLCAEEVVVIFRMRLVARPGIRLVFGPPTGHSGPREPPQPSSRSWRMYFIKQWMSRDINRP